MRESRDLIFISVLLVDLVNRKFLQTIFLHRNDEMSAMIMENERSRIDPKLNAATNEINGGSVRTRKMMHAIAT